MISNRGRFLVFLGLVSITNVTASAEPWSEKLGFEPGQKVVILDAREMGVSWEMNESGKQLLTNGQVSSVGVVATGPWFEDFARWARMHPEHDYGVAIALTNPYTAVHWDLLSSGHGTTTLVNANGKPWKNVVQLSSNATAEDVKHELDAQINAARNAGLQPTHICGYYGTVFSRPDLAGVFLGASKKYWLPAPVVELTPQLRAEFQRMGFPIDDSMAEMISNYPLPKLDDLKFLAEGETYEQKKANVTEQIKGLSPGLTQLVSRPAVETRGLQLLSASWQQRAWDGAILADEEFQKLLQDEGVVVTNWREIMHRFEGVQGNVLEANEE